jgi:hypothetical protein
MPLREFISAGGELIIHGALDPENSPSSELTKIANPVSSSRLNTKLQSATEVCLISNGALTMNKIGLRLSQFCKTFLYFRKIPGIKSLLHKPQMFNRS